MDKDSQKEEEKHYVELLQLSLEENWIIYPKEAPDFEVHDKYGIFGLEVTECHSGRSNSKGSLFKKEEMIRHGKIEKARIEFNGKYPHLSNMNIFYASKTKRIEEKFILDALEKNISKIHNIISPLVVYDNNNPIGELWISFSDLGEAKWLYISDLHGSIERANENIQDCIDKKLKKLDYYKKNYNVVSLLIYSNLFFNSEKIRPTDDFVPRLGGFHKVYFYSHGYVKTYPA